MVSSNGVLNSCESPQQVETFGRANSFNLFKSFFITFMIRDSTATLHLLGICVYIAGFFVGAMGHTGSDFVNEGSFSFGDLSWEPRRQGYGCPWLRCSNKSVYLPAYPTITRNKSMELTHTFILYLTVCSHFIAA